MIGNMAKKEMGLLPRTAEVHELKRIFTDKKEGKQAKRTPFFANSPKSQSETSAVQVDLRQDIQRG
jgi:hypothetical protein